MRYVSITVLGLDRGAMQVKKAIDADPSIKLIFLSSPGNPAGTLISLVSIRVLLDYEPFKGIVVVDEASPNRAAALHHS
jgi:histidinol-phosphate aminotransferase